MNKSFTRSNAGSPKSMRRTSRALRWMAVAVTLLAGCRRFGPAVEREGSDSLALTSADLQGGRFPAAFTCDGADTSPMLHWNGPPAGTRSFALILNDRSIGSFVHWVLYDLPPETTFLSASAPRSEQLPNGARQGRNDFDKIGYAGPCPPGHGEHRYAFLLFALDTKLNLPSGATRAEVDDAMKGHVLARGVFTAGYSR